MNFENTTDLGLRIEGIVHSEGWGLRDGDPCHWNPLPAPNGRGPDGGRARDRDGPALLPGAKLPKTGRFLYRSALQGRVFGSGEWITGAEKKF